MDNSTSEIKVGATTIAGLVVFLAIVSFLGVFKFSGGTYDFNVIYDNVNGLKRGNEVRYAGLNIGQVKDILIDGNKVKAILSIQKDIKIPEDADFSIGVDGVMGAKFITINPKTRLTEGYILPDQTVDGTKGQGLDEFMASSSKVLNKVEGIADAFHNVFGDPAVQKSMREGFLNARDISNNLNTFTKVMADTATANQGEITAMVSEMRGMAQRLNATADHLNSVMEAADNKGETGRNLAAMAANLATASARVEKVSRTFEKVADNPQTETDLQATIHNAREASAKANKILGVLGDAQPRADVMYNSKKDKWRSDVGVNFPVGEDGFFYLGGSNIGDDTKFDFQVGRNLSPAWWARTGIMEGKYGLGVGYKVNKQFKLFSDVYDFNATKLRVGGEYLLNDHLSLIGQAMDVRKSGDETAYVGLRSYF